MEKVPTVEEILADLDRDVLLMKEQAEIAASMHRNHLNFVALSEKLDRQADPDKLSPEAQDAAQKFIDDAIVSI